MRIYKQNGKTMMKNLSLNSRILFLLALLLAQLSLPMQIVHAATTATKEAYAVVSTDGKTLTFYYDTYKDSRPGTIYTSSNFRTSESNGWGGSASTITTVTFNSSFSSYTGLTSTAYWFNGMENLTSISGLSYLKTSNVTSMRDMFYDCKNLTSLYLSNFNTAKVTSMWNMFRNCKSLTSLNLSSFNTSSTTDMDNMFYGCESLTSLNLSGFNTANVIFMSSMFYGCNNLHTIQVSNQWTTNSVTSSSRMFYNCTNLVGGDGTVYDPNYTDKTKAYAGIGGYLTMEGQAGAREAYAVLSTDGTTLSFYYDNQKDSRAGTIFAEESFVKTDNHYWGSSSNNSSITTVNIDPTFADYDGLTSTAYWFYDCNLTTINGLHHLNTANVTDMSYMFSIGHFHGNYNYNLNSLDVSNFNTAKVTNMSWMFEGCSGLNTLDLSSFNTAKVTDMRGMFHVCSGLNTLDLSSFNTAKVTNMGGMFSGCSSLTSLDLSSFNTANVTEMHCSYGVFISSTNIRLYQLGMFTGCSSLTSLDLSSFNTAKVTHMGYLFCNCKNLHTIQVSNQWTTNSVTSSSSMFYNCTNLVGGDGTVYDPNYTDKTKAYAGIGGYLTMEGQAGAREAYAVLRTDKKTLTFYYDTFKNSRPGTVYDSSKFIKTWITRGWSTDDTTITTVTFNSTFSSYTGLTSTAYWFYGMNNLTTINGLSYLKTSNVTIMSSMFDGCSSLTSLNLSGFNTGNVTSMSSMFYGCSSLTSLDLSGFNTGNVTSMSSMFDGCSSLTSLNLSGFNTSNVTSMSYMFYGCSSLTSLDLSGFNTGNITSMSWMFDGCSGLISLDLSGFNTGNVKYMSSMFAGCSGLTSLDLSGFNTGNVTSMSSMFSFCSKLSTIQVSNQWTTNSVTFSSGMFYNCTSLVGGDGTTYDENYTDKTKAYAGRGGYLTLKVDDDLQYYLNSLTDTEDSFENGVYTRQFQNWDWQTLYVPFSMDYSDWQARFELASIGQLSSEDDVYYLNASIMEEGSTVQPNTPYLIRAKAKAASKLKVNPDNVVDEEENVFALQNTQELGWLAASITGVYTTQPVWYSSNTSSDIYNYRMLGGALSIPTNDDEVLPPNRWYLTLDSRVQPSQVRVRIIDTEATAISDPVCQHDLVNKDVNYAIYDMQGRKVAAGSEATDRLRKGLYIINNKKRMVK